MAQLVQLTMGDRIRLPEPKVRVSLEELARIQRGAATHITFSLTLACPLQCEHCIVNAGPDKGHTTMPLEVAERYARQMAELAAYGIKALSFTGGEPLLARRQLAVMSEAGAAAGMSCGVVTAAHWAHDREAAEKTIRRYPGVTIWDVSVDSYHGAWVSFENVRTAYLAARELGRQATIRFTYHDPPTQDDERVLRFIETFAVPEDVCSQKIRAVGRGESLALEESHKFHPWNKPCITQGLVIRYDGSVSPCCVNLVEERNHPFQLGDPRVRSLREMHEEYLSQPLLQMMRLIGFVEILHWLEEAELLDELRFPLPDDVCDLCPQLVTNSKVAGYLTARAGKPENQLRIAVLASRLLGEHVMLERVVREMEPMADQVDGYQEAVALVRENAAANAGTKREEEEP